MARLCYKAYWFSIEWSRAYPVENKLDEDALNRYIEIVELLWKHNI